MCIINSKVLSVSSFVKLSQVGGRLPVLPLSGLGHGHVDALQPLLSVLLILSFQHVGLTVREDLKGPWQPPITPLLGYHLRGKTKQTTTSH